MKDLTGQTFHCLTVLRFSHMEPRGKSIWLCKCDCGRERLSSRNNLQRGLNKSCGHLRLEYLMRGKKNVSSSPAHTRYEFGLDLDGGLEELEHMT